MLFLTLYVAGALTVSFLCSLLEANLLATRNAVLSQQRDDGNRGAGKLLHLKQHCVDDAISAILILNTGANTLGATLAGAQAAKVFGSNTVGIFSGVLTLLILIFSEIIPKTLGAVYTRKLSGFVGWTLAGLVRIMTPALFLSRVLTRLLTRGRTSGTSRSELSVVIATAAREGILSADESRMLENLLRFNDVRVHDIMTPRTVIFSLSAQATISDLLEAVAANVFSRIPLHEHDDPEEIVGYVLKSEVFKAVADGSARDVKLSTFQREVDFIPELATVRQAMRQLLEGRDPIAIVTDEHGAVAGLLTLEDLTETILGVEIVDESDRIADMRVLANHLRDRRLERMRRRQDTPLELRENQDPERGTG